MTRKRKSALFEPTLRWLYRRSLATYPRDFRAEYARDMEETFADGLRAARRCGPGAAFAFAASGIAEVVWSGLAERGADGRRRVSVMSFADIRYAFRTLRRSPAFTLLTLIVLAGGLAVSIFTFSFLYTAILKPLPLPDGARIVRVQEALRGRTRPLDPVELGEIRADARTVQLVGAFTERVFVAGDDRHQRVLRATATEPTMFDLTRARPQLGRVMRAEDSRDGAEPTIVLSDWAWRAMFGADSAIVGRQIALSGTLTRVVGVMPAGFGFPVAAASWVPLRASMFERARRDPALDERVSVYARLAPGATRERAETELRGLLARVRREHPRPVDDETTREPANVTVRTFQMAQLDDDGPLAFAILNVIASLILLLACINVVNLLLGRANERARETAVRLALGASRARLMMQSMWETVVLAIVGGALATAIAAWSLDAVNAWLQVNLEGNLAFWWSWHLDRAGIVAAGAFVTATIALLGGVVAARVSSAEFTAVLRDGGARAGGRREGRASRWLVVAQVSIVTVLMFFGVMSSFVAYRVAHANVGYDTRNVLSTNLPPLVLDSSTAPREVSAAIRVVRELEQSGVVDSVYLRARLATVADAEGAFIIDGVGAFSTATPRAFVTATYGATSLAGAHVQSGRGFGNHDTETSEAVAIVSRSLAETSWPGRSALGQTIRVAEPSDSAHMRRIVGVVDDVLMGAPFSRDRSTLAIYLPLAQAHTAEISILFRHRGDAAAAQSALYRALAMVNPRVIPPDVSTYDEILAKSTLIAKAVTTLFGMCFAFALLLAVSGTYALMARAIHRRTREIGIRRALGATDESVVTLLLRQGARQLGLGVGLAAPVMIAVAIGFAAFFPVPLGIALGSAVFVAAAIVAVVLLATYVPTRRALAIAPRDALGTD